MLIAEIDESHGPARCGQHGRGTLAMPHLCSLWSVHLAGLRPCDRTILFAAAFARGTAREPIWPD